MASTNLINDSLDSTYIDESVRPEEVYRWIQEVSYRQADGQALHTVIYLSAAAILWALLYFNYLLLSVYFTPITWAMLCAIPLRRWQETILKSIDGIDAVRSIALHVISGVCTTVVVDLMADAIIGTLCRVGLAWVVFSRLVSALGWSLGSLVSAGLLLAALLIYLFWKVLASLWGGAMRWFVAPLARWEHASNALATHW
jgi:hypothetical protein